ncbi:MAG: hypothetical protein HOV80_12400, partial [Polyangiaceae bacterium]|nr:hypothetical protein [Polyangiaceae bacterium]
MGHAEIDPSQILSRLSNLALEVASGEELDVRRYNVRESLDELFEIDLEVASPNPDVDLGAISGQACSFHIRMGGGAE